MKLLDWIKQKGIWISWKWRFGYTGSKMETSIVIRRKWYTDNSTIGDMLFNGDFQCYTLEDTVRKSGVKISGKTAIPPGQYELIMNYSNKFGKFMPLLLDVPGFSGIRIHSGNSPKDTEGCILVGRVKPEDQPDLILESRIAFNELMSKLEPAIKNGKVFVSVLGGNYEQKI